MAEDKDGAHKRNEVELFFGDGTYLFRFGLKQFAEHDEKCGPLGAVFARVLAGRGQVMGTDVGFSTMAAYRYADLRETVRLGLIGGAQGEVDEKPVKVDAVRALKLVERYVDGQPTEDTWKLAAAILTAVCQGYDAKVFTPVLPGDEDEEASPDGEGGKGGATATASITPSHSETAKSGGSDLKKPDA